MLHLADVAPACLILIQTALAQATSFGMIISAAASRNSVGKVVTQPTEDRDWSLLAWERRHGRQSNGGWCSDVVECERSVQSRVHEWCMIQSEHAPDSGLSQCRRTRAGGSEQTGVEVGMHGWPCEQPASHGVQY